MKRIHLIVFIVLFFFLACKKEKNEEPIPHGHLTIDFSHVVNQNELFTDLLCYVNAAGNMYSVTQLMYFISDVTLYKNGKPVFIVDDYKAIHYVDIDIPETLTWQVFDEIPADTYDSISFVFGLNEQRNQSFMFINAPEVNMMWPDILGGGYHYMMLNGKWHDSTGVLRSMNLHLGIGQIYKNNSINTDSITGYIHNYFTVNLKNSGITINDQQTVTINVRMNIDKWFDAISIFDLNKWGGDIMQKQDAMEIVATNGKQVFEIIK